MKIIVGLGNPGDKYQGTRHNVGFFFIEQLAAHPKLNPVGSRLQFVRNKRLKSEIAEANVSGEKILLVKPQTFMNLSGEAIGAILRYFEADIDDLLVICDDLSLPLGIARLRLSGSSGGHKGLQSIIDILGEDFKRLRIGISNRRFGSQESEQIYQKIEAKKFVLEKFSLRELSLLTDIVAEMVELVIGFISGKQISAQTFEL